MWELLHSLLHQISATSYHIKSRCFDEYCGINLPWSELSHQTKHGKFLEFKCQRSPWSQKGSICHHIYTQLILVLCDPPELNFHCSLLMFRREWVIEAYLQNIFLCLCPGNNPPTMSWNLVKPSATPIIALLEDMCTQMHKKEDRVTQQHVLDEFVTWSLSLWRETFADSHN
jgi:hypothetical protein